MATIDSLDSTIYQDLSDRDVWTHKTYRCHVGLIREDDGTFSAIVLNLPGVGSCGDTEEDAMKNCREAIRGALESYDAANGTIPWKDPASYEISNGTTQKWIVVNA
jgi:predicted RNase H-like HicB family nuclease